MFYEIKIVSIDKRKKLYLMVLYINIVFEEKIDCGKVSISKRLYKRYIYNLESYINELVRKNNY